MLASARRKLGSVVDLREGWAESLPFETEQFDLVVSCNMFHYVSQPMTALREMKRVLRVGGQLVLTDWWDDYVACRVCDFYLRLFSPAHVKMYGGAECALGCSTRLDMCFRRYPEIQDQLVVGTDDCHSYKEAA